MKRFPEKFEQADFAATHDNLTISGHNHSVSFAHKAVTATFGGASATVNYDALKKGTLDGITVSVTLGSHTTDLNFGATLERKVVAKGPPIEMDFIAILQKTFTVPRGAVDDPDPDAKYDVDLFEAPQFECAGAIKPVLAGLALKGTFQGKLKQTGEDDRSYTYALSGTFTVKVRPFFIDMSGGSYASGGGGPGPFPQSGLAPLAKLKAMSKPPGHHMSPGETLLVGGGMAVAGAGLLLVAPELLPFVMMGCG